MFVWIQFNWRGQPASKKSRFPTGESRQRGGAILQPVVTDRNRSRRKLRDRSFIDEKKELRSFFQIKGQVIYCHAIKELVIEVN